MMLHHLLKLIWKRKFRNLMLTLEILLAFVVVFAIAAVGARTYQLYRAPIGFVYANVWSAVLLPPDLDALNQNQQQTVDNFTRALRALPQVEQVAFAARTPYVWSNEGTDLSAASGNKAATETVDVSDDYFAVLGMKLAEGRWFSHLDDGAAEPPVVITRSLAQALFPGQPAVGKLISEGNPGDKSSRVFKVTGVIEAFRNKGEFGTPGNFMFKRFVPGVSKYIGTAVVKLRSAVPRAFDSDLHRQLKLVRSDWTYETAPLAELRADMQRVEWIPLAILAVIGAFLLLMVSFGLFGVLWQNTTLRIPEIGLRRAVGADAGAIYRQIIVEQILLSTGAMLAALLLLVQLPITGAFGESLNWPVFASAAGISMVKIYLISLLCAVYPGWRASRLSPTEALHYE